MSYKYDKFSKIYHTKMEKDQIITVLNNWNFWNKDLDVGILREDYLNKLIKFINTDKVISLIGVRRSGNNKTFSKALYFFR